MHEFFFATTSSLLSYLIAIESFVPEDKVAGA
jgi:hypothetical protein